MQKRIADIWLCGLENLLHNLFMYFQEDQLMTSIDDKRDERDGAGLYVLGGVAIIVVLVWAFWV
jgi:hypothetical protein